MKIVKSALLHEAFRLSGKSELQPQTSDYQAVNIEIHDLFNPEPEQKNRDYLLSEVSLVSGLSRRAGQANPKPEFFRHIIKLNQDTSNTKKHIMKNILLLLCSTFILMSCGDSSDKEKASTETAAKKTGITLKGSDTVLPLAQKESENYMKEHSEVSITVVGGGSGVGITSLLDGTTDIAMSSRPLKMDEKMKFTEKKISLTEKIIASDALAVIVHPKNKISKLTREQIADIYTGKISNWKEVGGNDGKIIAYARETSSGTYEFFKEHVMDKKNYATNVLNMPATGAIVQSVSQTEGAIGYVGLAYETKDVKQLAVSYDQGKTYYEPSVAGAQDGTYPVSRPLYFYYSSTNTAVIQPFVNYILSEAGQATVLEVGYVPLKK